MKRKRETTKPRTRTTDRPSQIAQTQERMKNEGGKSLPTLTPTPIPVTKRKLIADIPTREFLSFYKRFYKTLTGEDPYWDHHIHFEDGIAIDYRDPEDDDNPFSDPVIGDTHWNHEVNKLWENHEPTGKNAKECDALFAMIEDLPIIIQRWIELHPTILEERVRNLADLDKLRESDKKLLKDNFPNFTKWKKELYQETGIDWEFDCQIKRFELTVNKDDRPWTIEKKALRELRRILENRLKIIKRRLKSETWPTETKWIKETKWLRELWNRYTFLLPILRELWKARLYADECKAIHEKYNIPYLKAKAKDGTKLQRPLLFIRTDYEKLAGRAQCSEISLTNYLRALTRTGLIQLHHRPGPKGYTYYAFGYYYRTKQGWVAARFLKQETKNKLKGFNPNSQI